MSGETPPAMGIHGDTTGAFNGETKLTGDDGNEVLQHIQVETDGHPDEYAVSETLLGVF